MQKIYKKLLFDLDNTLVDDDYNRKYAIRKILLKRNEKVSQESVEKFIEIDNQFWKDRASGKIKNPYEFKNDEEKTEWLRAQRFVQFFTNISFEDAVNINNEYIDYLSENIMPIENSKEILEYLVKKNFEIYIITNGPIKAVKEKLNKANIIFYIKDIFTAEEAGHMKPHAQFFEKFFKKVNIEFKNDILIIGDELEKDILGGIKIGIDTCWFNNKNQINDTIFKPTFEIKNLIELKNIL